MALTLENALNVKRRTRDETRSPAVSLVLKALFMHVSQTLGDPDLQFTAVSGLESADVVAADAACKVYCVYAKKPTASTVDAWLRGTNHATAATGADFSAYFKGTSGGGQEHAFVFMDGLKMGTGFTIGCHTAVGGTTKSLVADAPIGFAIVGAP